MIGEGIVDLHKGSVTEGQIAIGIGIEVAEMIRQIVLTAGAIEGLATIDKDQDPGAQGAFLLVEIDVMNPDVHVPPIEGTVIEVFAQILLTVDRFSITGNLVLPRQDARKCVNDLQFQWKKLNAIVVVPSRPRCEKNANLPPYLSTRPQRAAVTKSDARSLRKKTRKVAPTKRRARNTLVAQMMTQIQTVLTVIRRKRNPRHE